MSIRWCGLWLPGTHWAQELLLTHDEAVTGYVMWIGVMMESFYFCYEVPVIGW